MNSILVGVLVTASLIAFWYFKPAYYSFRPTLASFAVVTGASDGIGKALAINLARKGFNVVLLARSTAKLNAIKLEIEAMGLKAIVYPFDFDSPPSKEWVKLEKELSGLEIGVLINNVGVSHEFPVPFLDESSEKCSTIVSVNVDAMLKMTRIVLPQMVKRNHGLILNIGSGLGKLPSALLSVYAGSKAFVRQWSLCLSAEVNPLGVHVEHINTYLVQTSMSKIRKSSLFIPTPATFAHSVLQNCGLYYDSTPYLPHRVTDFVLSFIPTWVLLYAGSAFQRSIRKQVLRKQARSKMK